MPDEDWGPRSARVLEVVDVGLGGTLLARGLAPFPPGIKLTHSLERAKALAWSECFGVDEYTWTDIRERQAAPIVAASYGVAWYRTREDAFASLSARFARAVAALGPLQSALLDDIVADLHNVAEARALLDSPPLFWEQLFAVYRAGGWPCGWSGSYPEGSIIAFAPELRA